MHACGLDFVKFGANTPMERSLLAAAHKMLGYCGYPALYAEIISMQAIVLNSLGIIVLYYIKTNGGSAGFDFEITKQQHY